jgi:hypothetical protein
MAVTLEIGSKWFEVIVSELVNYLRIVVKELASMLFMSVLDLKMVIFSYGQPAPTSSKTVSACSVSSSRLPDM